MKFKITFLIVCALFLSTITGWGQEILGGGTIEGSTLTWSLADNGILKISATSGDEGMPDGVTPWEDLASDITSIEIGNGVTGIGKGSFGSLPELVSVSMANSLKTVGDYAFSNCGKLEYVNLAEVETIGESAFDMCSSLEMIQIPATVTSIGEGVFSSCSSLRQIYIVEGNTSYVVSNDLVLYDIGKTILLFYPQFKNNPTFTVPNTVETIGKKAFINNGWLETIVIPSSVKYINDQAFLMATSLKTVQLSEGLISIGEGAFQSCGFTSIDLPQSLTTIKSLAFNYCENLTTINMSTNVGYAGAAFVQGCTSLQAINVAAANPWYASRDGVMYVKDAAGALVTLWVHPAGKTYASFVVPDGVTEIAADAFRDCKNLSSITLAESVTTIGTGAFANCSALETIDLKNVTSIRPSAFYKSGLKSIVVPDGVTDLPDGVFNHCFHLESIVLPEGLTSIGNVVFQLNGKLKNIDIPSSVTSIGAWAFNACTTLVAVTIPEGVSSIGENTFASCRELKDVTVYWETPVAAHATAFQDINPDAVLNVPPGAGNAYRAAEVWSQFTIKEQGSIVIEADEPEITGSEGSISLSLRIPPGSTLRAGFLKVIFPNGMRIDTAHSKLAQEFSADSERSIAKIEDENAWEITIAAINPPPANLRSSTVLTKIMDIGFLIDDNAPNGDYQIKIEDLSFHVDDANSSTSILSFQQIIDVTLTRAVVTSITISPASIGGRVGGSSQLTATVAPDDAPDKSVAWTSSNDAVAAVSPAGLVTYIAPGTAVITATSVSNPSITASITVIITEGYDPTVIPVTAITITPGSLTGTAGATAQLTATVSPADATNSAITWTSSNNAVATVDDAGLVTYVAAGTATITATAADGSGISASVAATVSPQMSAETAPAAFAVRPLNGALQISGLIPGEELSIYGISGLLIYKGKAAAAEQYILLNIRGTLIITAGEKTAKVVLNQ